MTSGRVDTRKGKQRKLTAKQARFVEEYLVDLNATQAAMRAGYAGNTIGPHLLLAPHISAAVGEHLSKRSERTRLTADEIIAGLRREANDLKRNDGRTRVKAFEVLAKLGGFISDMHLHKHFDAYEEQQRVSQEQVLDALPLEMRRELLETVKKLQVKRIGEQPAVSGDVIDIPVEDSPLLIDVPPDDPDDDADEDTDDD